MSTMRVLSSITRSDLDAECQAAMSMTPRSPRAENETSGTTSQPPISAIHLAIASWS
jgi:hypothetical protein